MSSVPRSRFGNILPGGNRVERVAQDVEERALSAERLKKPLPKRRVLYQGDDAIIIEICRETEESPVAAALVRALDHAKKQNISFCCHTQTTAVPLGRKCISWLQKEQRKSHSKTATHGIIPYRLILLEVCLSPSARRDAGLSPLGSGAHGRAQ